MVGTMALPPRGVRFHVLRPAGLGLNRLVLSDPCGSLELWTGQVGWGSTHSTISLPLLGSRAGEGLTVRGFVETRAGVASLAIRPITTAFIVTLLHRN